MKRIFILIAAAVAAVACNSGNIKLEGRLIGCDTTMVYVESLGASFGSQVVDSVRTDERGKFSIKINAEGDQLALYNLNCNGQRIPLLLAKGDNVTINSVGSIARNYEVSGSEESALLKQVTFLMQDGAARLDSLSTCFVGLTNEADRQQLLKDYTQEYYRIKRSQIEFIVANSSSLAALYALYQRLPNDNVLFNGATDVVYYRMVADAIVERYPSSPYLSLVRRDIAAMDLVGAAITSQLNYPDLNIPDMFGNKIQLSSLQGKVILVDFWSAMAGNSNQLNADLKEIYEKYAESGFEIYQIGIESSKAVWVSAVQEQNLPWISVSDLQGTASSAIALYNVQTVPTNFLIDREGNIVGKNIYGADLDKRVAALL